MRISYKIIPIAIVIIFTQIIACEKQSKEPPLASFTISDELARIGDVISFQNTSEGANSFDWDFGDGSNSTEENPDHIYAANGTYQVTLKATNSGGYDEYTNGLRISYWSFRSDMPNKRGFNPSSVVDGKIYVVSGGDHHGQGALSAVDEYDPVTDTWSAKAEIPTPRQELTTDAVNGKIYAIGGGESPNIENYNGIEVYSTVEEYDPLTNTWTTGDPMPVKKWGHSSCTIDSKIYVIGGLLRLDGTKDVLEYHE
jgi:PKD repeat protein